VQAACAKLNDEIEGNPDLFHRMTYQTRLRAVRTRLAGLLGARPDECVMVHNASSGINTVLRNFAWRTGDRLIGGELRSISILPLLGADRT
jgi:selenocysteine lyase/cysteine desulfurase